MNRHGVTLGRAFLVCGLFLSFAICPRCLAEEPAAPKKGVTIEGITEYRLDNGLRVLLFPDESTPTVTVNLTVMVGSRHEGYGETGMAHLLEHMVFKGTPLHSNVPKALKDHGADFNGTTWVDRTNYFETMIGTDENLEFGIRLEADRMVNSYVKREDLASEMSVVRSEFEQGENSPNHILSQRMMAVAFEWHNYGKSTIGNRTDIERVPIDRLQAFYRNYYQPDNALLIVAGKFNPARALEYTAKYFGVLKKPQRKLLTTYTEEPAQDGERTVILRRVGKIGVVGVMYHTPAGPHADFPAVQVLNNIMESQPTGRLYKALVESKKATSVNGDAFGWHDPGVIEFTAEVPTTQSLEAARDTMLQVIETLAESELKKEEVDRAKLKILKERELLMTKSNRIGRELSEWAAMGDWRLFFLHRDRIDKVTPEDVSRVARNYLKRSNRTVGLYYPTTSSERSPIPETPQIAELVKNYTGGKAIAAGEAFDPTPANIEKRVRRQVLPSGLKTALLQKKTRGESVVAKLTLRYGTEETLNGHMSASQFIGSLMMRGTKKHTRQQIQDELDRLKARLNGGGIGGDLSFSIEAKKETLPGVLRLLGEILREPTFPEAEFEILKRVQRDTLEKGLTEPNALAFRDWQRRLNPYPPDNIRYTPTIEESMARLDKVTIEEVHKLYTELIGGQTGEFVVVGDFEQDETLKVVQEFLADWKPSVAYQRIEKPAQTKVAGAKTNILTPDKANAVFIAGHMLGMTDTDPDFPALEIADYLFGGGTLSSRLGNRVRQKEGLSYGIQSNFSADPKDPSARFLIYAICNPKNIDKVDQAVAEELNKLLKEGVPEEELTEAKKAYLQQQEVQRARDQSLTDVLAAELHEGRTFAYYQDLEEKISRLTPEQVNEAVKKHWQPKKLVIVRAGDFNKKAAP